MLGGLIKTAIGKWLGSIASKRFSMGAAAVIVSAIVMFGSQFGVEMDEQTQTGLTGFIASLLVLIWADSQRPLDPRDDDGKTVFPQ